MPSSKTRKRSAAEMEGGRQNKPSSATDKNNNTEESEAEVLKKLKNYEKYSLRPRSIQVRIETEKRQKEEPKKEPKPKQKPPPLSKYRRKTANARERNRMREINEAFDTLQSAIPSYPVLPVNAQGKACEKLTKITTLRLAMNYIQQLSNSLLSDPVLESSEGGSSFGESSLIPSGGSSISGSGGSLSSGSSSVSEFSPASSYAMSPLSSSSPAGPECFQTVMRSAVSPTIAAAVSSHHQQMQLSMSNANSQNAISQIIILPVSPSNGVGNKVTPISHNAPLPAQHFLSSAANMSIPSPICQNAPTSNKHSLCSFDPISASLNKTVPTDCTKLPPISTSLSSALLRKCMSTFATDAAQLTSGHLGDIFNSFSNFSNSSPCQRNGSLSSLTESDLSEYASDLLSDEGSSLDDPMFEDFIGIAGVPTDLELLLQTDPVETLSF